MSHYSEDPSMVRVDFFKESGKWYCTEAIKWLEYSANPAPGVYHLIHDVFKDSLRIALGPRRLQGMTAVCLEPYHENEHPLMVSEW